MKRRTVSMSASTFTAFRDWCATHDRPMAAVVEELVCSTLGIQPPTYEERRMSLIPQGVSRSTKQRGKAPPVDYSFGSIRAYRQQFTGTITPIEQVRGQSANRTELKPERRDVLRRDPPPKKSTPPQKGGERKEALPAPAKAVVERQPIANVVLF